MSKSIRVSALLVLCLGLMAFPTFAGQKAPSFSVSLSAPTIQSIAQEDLPGKVLDTSRMPILLDGIPLSEDAQAKALRGLFLFVDKEQGVIHAFRTREELEAHAIANGALTCDTPSKAAAPAFCSFWSGPNCTGNGVFVACGNLIANINLLLGVPVQSFTVGCGGAILIPNGDCTTPPNGVLVTAPVGICINIANSPFNCAGCAPVPPSPTPAQ
jgi:hypothetical protein